MISGRCIRSGAAAFEPAWQRMVFMEHDHETTSDVEALAECISGRELLQEMAGLAALS